RSRAGIQGLSNAMDPGSVSFCSPSGMTPWVWQMRGTSVLDVAPLPFELPATFLRVHRRRVVGGGGRSLPAPERRHEGREGLALEPAGGKALARGAQRRGDALASRHGAGVVAEGGGEVGRHRGHGSLRCLAVWSGVFDEWTLRRGAPNRCVGGHK